jgi:hypothetical protein
MKRETYEVVVGVPVKTSFTPNSWQALIFFGACQLLIVYMMCKLDN